MYFLEIIIVKYRDENISETTRPFIQTVAYLLYTKKNNMCSMTFIHTLQLSPQRAEFETHFTAIQRSLGQF